jgi:GTPase involved in cell partitioning and DNA repair
MLLLKGSASFSELDAFIPHRGLGHAFLRHIQRTRVLLFVLDISGRLFGDSAAPLPPVQQLALLQRELQLYDPSLLKIPALVVANKTDSLQIESQHGGAVTVEHVQQWLDELTHGTDLPVLLASGLQRKGLDDLCAALWQYAQQ